MEKENIKFEDLLESVKENKGIPVVMCEYAFDDTDEELILMSKRIKELARNGAVVHIIGKE